MKNLKILTLIVIFTIMSSCGFESSKKNETTNFIEKTKVENVQIKKEHSNAWAVTGMIRNNSSSNLKGAVKIKFLTTSGDIVHTTRAKVNDGDFLKPGQAGLFKYYTKPENFSGVTDFDVEFYER